jgi:L-asparagine transporter-like permease
MEKFLNIYFYNFYLIGRFFNKLIAIYLNPFTWMNNFSKRKLGSKLFFEHMEKNFPTFLNQYKYIFRLKIQFIPFLTLVNLFVITVLFFFLKLNFPGNFFIVLITSSCLAFIEAYVYIFNNNKYQEYFKEFYDTKKYDYPLVTFLTITLILSIWFYIIFFVY